MILAPACGAARPRKKYILCLLSHCGGGGFPRVRRSQWRQPMPTNRAFLLACATVATLGLSAATPADARPCREGSCSARSAIAGAMQAAMAKQMQAAMAKKMQAAMVAKQAEMEKQMQAAMVAKQAEMEKKAKAEMAAKQAEMEKQASNAAAGVSMVPTENPMAPPPSLSEGKGKGARAVCCTRSRDALPDQGISQRQRDLTEQLHWRMGHLCRAVRRTLRAAPNPLCTCTVYSPP